MNILVTGGAGYIGSHACKRLLDAGHTVVAIDDLSRGHARAMDLLSSRGNFAFRECSIGDEAQVRSLLEEHRIETVMHFAALAYVGESVSEPLRYYRNNVEHALAFLRSCDASGVRRFVFSSSCATYGDPPEGMIPVPETCPQSPTSPYGWTKLIFERALIDWADSRRTAGSPVALTMLRYFNVAGADSEGILGEDHDPETHLIPIAVDAALGRRDALTIFGTDYPTPDGTCIRDYVHVEDLADAHILAMTSVELGRTVAYNVGVGRGYSVREIIGAVEAATGRPVPATEGERRAGDAIALYADPAKITGELGWSPRHTDITKVVASAAAWLERNPDGYAD